MPLGLTRERWSTILAGLLLSGCGIFGTGDCTSELAPAIRLRIRDADTRQKPGIGSTILVTDASYAESSPPPGTDPVSLDEYGFAFERAGRYAISVKTAGYRDWSRTGIEVGWAGCGHVSTKTVTAMIMRSAGTEAGTVSSNMR